MITAGEILKNKREQLGKSLDNASSDTKVQKRFLKYIEQNEFSKFESEVFLTGFIKIYAKYLDLDVNKILALYRRSNPEIKEKKPDNKLKTTRKKVFQNLPPKFFIMVLLVIFSLTIFGYVGFQIYKFQSPPDLLIEEPLDNTSVSTEEILVKGKTEKNVVVEINELPVAITEDGEFEKIVELNEGVNILNIKARKNSNNVLETVEVRKITFVKAQESIVTETEITENKLKLTVEDTAAWIKLDIDDENKLSQVVQPSETEFIVKERFHVITGRLSNTLLYFNEDIVPWPNSRTSGVAEITCEIAQNNAINCQ